MLTIGWSRCRRQMWWCSSRKLLRPCCRGLFFPSLRSTSSVSAWSIIISPISSTFFHYAFQQTNKYILIFKKKCTLRHNVLLLCSSCLTFFFESMLLLRMLIYVYSKLSIVEFDIIGKISIPVLVQWLIPVIDECHHAFKQDPMAVVCALIKARWVAIIVKYDSLECQIFIFILLLSFWDVTGVIITRGAFVVRSDKLLWKFLDLRRHMFLRWNFPFVGSYDSAFALRKQSWKNIRSCSILDFYIISLTYYPLPFLYVTVLSNALFHYSFLLLFFFVIVNGSP